MDLWQSVVFTPGPPDDVVRVTNSDGTFTRLTGTGFVLGPSPDFIPSAGTVDLIERLDTDGTTVLETFSGLTTPLPLTTFYAEIFNFIEATLLAGNDTLTGGTADDVLFGWTGSDVIHGGDGDDFIYSDDTPGADVIDGGNDLDTAQIERNSSVVAFIADFSDPLVMVTLADGTTVVNVEAIQFTGGSGNDVLVASNDSSSSLLSPQQANVLNGGDGDDTLTASAAGATLSGDGGGDTLHGGAGSDQITGGEGDDIITTGGGDDFVDGGDGSDEITATGDGNHSIYADGFFSFAPGNDIVDLSLVGPGFFNYVNGGGGDDDITGSAGDDVLDGDGGEIAAAGNDTIDGGAGNDTINGGLGDDTIDGGSGNDTIYSYDGEGSDDIDGGADIEDVAYVLRTSSGVTYLIDFSNPGSTVSIADGGGNFTTIVNVEHVNFSASTGNDVLTASNGLLGASYNYLFGDAGDDTLYAGSNGATLGGGAGMDTLHGAAGDDLLLGDEGDDTIYTGGNSGLDSVYGGDGDDEINAGPGNNFIDAGSGDDIIVLALASGYANTVLAGDGRDFVFGSSGNDIIDGGSGDDTFAPGLGDDDMAGGLGRDHVTYNGILGALHIDLDILGPQDTVSAGFDSFHGIEDLTGSFGDDVIAGNGEDNALTGGGGHDELYGRGGRDVLLGDSGDDDLFGGDGDDVLLGGQGDDLLDGGSGNDNVSYLLASGGVTVSLATTGLQAIGGGEGNDELVSIEWINGSNHADVLTGSAADNRIIGEGGNDRIEGGAGADELHGGDGIDTLSYAGSNAGVTINLATNTATGGHATGDTITTFENVTGSAHADVLTGNASSNVLDGGAGADTLDGGGVVDQMYGGADNDVYYVDVYTDAVYEGTGEGTFDQVYASVSYALTPGAQVERLATTSQTGTAAITLIGNEFGQQMLGNNGNNTLAGGGGIDSFIGYGGNDIYVVDHASETITEIAGQGTDAVYTTVSYTLAAGLSIERLVAAPLASTNVVNLTGNELGQVIVGNNGVNTINGGGGNDSIYGMGGNDYIEGAQGNDSLFGGTGVDRFIFRESLGSASGIDRIYDMTLVDNIVVDALAVNGLTSLTANQFRLGTAAGDADDRIIYDATSGVFWFDPDGTGAQAAILFGVIDGAPSGVDHTWFELM